MQCTRIVLLCILAFGAALIAPVHAQTKSYDVTYYRVNLTLDRANDSLHGDVSMTARAITATDHVLQHAKFLTLDSILIGGMRLQWSAPDSAGTYTVTLPTAIAPNVAFTITTYYHAKGHPEVAAQPWGGVTDSTGMMFAMGVGLYAPYVSCTRHWMPCYDLPDDKPDSVDLYFKTNDNLPVASNGLLIADVPTKNGRSFYWHVGHPIATYLLTFATGNFEKLNIANALNLPFEAYAFASDTAAVRTEMTNYVAPALAFFDSLFAKYPFEKVGYVMAPIGSMEHQTMITLVHQALNATSTTAQHELSHQWWGDRVTCQTFDDAWLNEGMATYCESLVQERFNGIARYWSAQHANIAGAISSGSSLPLHGAPSMTVPRNNYPYAIIYQKGAAVLGMLRYFLGDSLFFQAWRTYGNKHAYATATSDDLWHDFEAATGRDLGWFFKPWVFGIGYPILQIAATHGGQDVQLAITQSQDSLKDGFFRLPLTVEARLHGTKERATIWLDSTRRTWAQVHFSFSPDSIVVDPDGAVIKKITSQTLSIATPGVRTNELRILNNPVQNGRLQFALSSDKPTELSIINTAGVTVLRTPPDSISESQKHGYSIAGLASGAYFLIARTATESWLAKFVVE